MTEQEIDALAFEHTRTNKRADLAFKAGYQAAMKENEKLKKDLKAVMEENSRNLDKNFRLKNERDAYKKAAQEWMNDYDKLKNKYEPMVAVTSEGEKQND